MNKAPDAFRTISEVAVELGLPQHVLRFWETRFPQIRPMKRGGGRRYYRPEDVNLLRGIRHLLYADGYTVRGVQRILREQGVRTVQSVGQGTLPEPAPEHDAGAKAAHAVDPELPLSIARPAAHDRQDSEMGRGEMGNGEPERGKMDRGEIDRDARPLAATAPHHRSRNEAVAPAAEPVAAPTIDSAAGPGSERAPSLDLDRLKAALAELEECRRLLDRAVDGE